MAVDHPKRRIKVFIASPGDLVIERSRFKKTIDELNIDFDRGADVEFVPVGWEDAKASTGRRPQSVINHDIDACDIFILALWRRWGQPAEDAHPLSSYTEEEFYLALGRWETTKAPEIFVFFKHIDPGQMADPGEQLKKVLDFRAKLERSRQVLYRLFNNEDEFAREIERHLIAYVKGDLPKAEDQARVPILPESVLREIEKANEEAKRAVAEAQAAQVAAKSADERAATNAALADALADKLTITLTESASRAALEGRTEEARQLFARATQAGNDPAVLWHAFEFYQRILEYDSAYLLLRRLLSTPRSTPISAETAKIHGHLAELELKRGNAAAAVRYFNEAHRIAEAIDHRAEAEKWRVKAEEAEQGADSASQKASGPSIIDALRRRGLRAVLQLFFRIRHDGEENVPTVGPVLLVSNLQSLLDSLIIGCWLRRSSSNMMVVAALGPFRAMSVGPNTTEGEVFRKALGCLQQSGVFLIFPEGTRTPDGSVKEFKRGAAFLLRKTRCPVVPVAIEGAHDVWPKWRHLPRLFTGRVYVRYGKPMLYDEVMNKGPDEAMARMHEIIDLMRKDLRAELRYKSKPRGSSAPPPDSTDHAKPASLGPRQAPGSG